MSYNVDNSTYFPAHCIIVQDDWAPEYSGYRFGSTVPLSRYFTGNKNPNWRQQVANMQNATTAFDGVWQRIDGVTRDDLNTTIYGLYGGPKTFKVKGFLSVNYAGFFPWMTWTSYADAKASNKFLSKVRAAQVKVSGPTFLGELGESLRMIKKPAGALQDRIKKYLKDVKKAKSKRHSRPLDWVKDAGDLWLENAFGWQPLLNDIQGGIDAYNSLVDKDRVVYISAGGRDEKVFADEAIYNTLPATGSWYQIKTTCYQQSNVHVVRYRGALLAQAATTARDRFARFGFTPSEFVPTAWELLPWSFLIDYFASVGDVLTGLVTDTSQVRWVNRSDIKTTRRSTTSTFWYDSNYWWMLTVRDLSSPGSAHFESKTVNRSAGVGIPTPQIRFSLSQSVGHLENMAALMAAVGLSIHPQRLSGRNFRL